MNSSASPVIKEITRRIDDLGTQAAVADELGISASLLSEIISGRRGLSPALLDKLGFEKVVIHVRREHVAALQKAIAKAVR